MAPVHKILRNRATPVPSSACSSMPSSPRLGSCEQESGSLEMIRKKNRERKMIWRKNNSGKNKDNDLKCRVKKRANDLYGPFDSVAKQMFVEQEFQKRRNKRLARENRANSSGSPQPTPSVGYEDVADMLGFSSSNFTNTPTESSPTPMPEEVPNVIPTFFRGSLEISTKRRFVPEASAALNDDTIAIAQALVDFSQTFC
ncbi:hypothetical protein CONCODRAFT_78763 [Conidiobolus coronatus NRRL 28638]|uniref:DUF3020 domain-containing protein n=1 Tax=Conidiobolus coronatus (strain ATCC 28846 / CBS 209.66 / NRRL 28638) TaxID=796925 RepID=A0A137P6M3_CONC2|nr:hypothetical protein CONCODRAFT_78763 [Conidiobolus coronatus NRRL 28638]|eukprot:KXN70584.1 hypothetical protein CONCODRAFT_78763 [Conidiobolus coronatus NRRL 28638]